MIGLLKINLLAIKVRSKKSNNNTLRMLFYIDSRNSQTSSQMFTKFQLRDEQKRSAQNCFSQKHV